MSTIRARRGYASSVATWVGATAVSFTAWARHARQIGFLGTTLLLAWELRITLLGGDISVAATAVRLATVLLLYGIGRWPIAVALASLPLVVSEYIVGMHDLSATILVPLVVAAVLIATQPRYRGYLYVVTAIALITAVQPSTEPMADLASWSVVFLIPCVVGEGARYVLSSIELIRHTTEAELRQQRREVARELHDTSIHDITSVIMALERAKLRGVSDPGLLAEIEHAAGMARQSVVSMRGVLTILREDGSEDGATRRRGEQPGGATQRAATTVRQALDDARALLVRAGHQAQVHVEDGSDAPLPYSVQMALVRVIQECTVNMAKYAAPGSSCAIMLERTSSESSALFINERDRSSQHDNALSSGLGLIGIRERIAIVGGTLSVRDDDARWLVRVTIPTIGSATEGQTNSALQQ